MSPRATTLKERNNLECPNCGSILTRSRGGGRSDSGDHRLRRRECEDCGLLFVSAEVAVMYDDGTPVPITALDSEYRLKGRARGRHRVGYHGTPAGRHPYIKSADLKIKVSVQRPVRSRSKNGPWPEDYPA